MWMIIGIFFLMLLIGVPVAFGVGISSMLYLALNGKDLVILTQRIFAGGDSFTLMAIPLFIFAGEIMNACGVTKRIVGFANELVGFIPGGLAHVNILASMLFAGVSGSTSADVASIGGMLIGSMDEAGFDRDYATAVTAASATIGSIIPPSILMVIMGVTTGMSIGGLFMAGIVPGLLLGLAMMAYSYFVAIRENYPRDPNPFTARRFFRELWKALPALMAPTIIMGGIMFGVFTSTEAAAVASFYGLIVGVFLYRELDFRKVCACCVEACETSAVIIVLMAMATLFGNIMTIEDVPGTIARAILGITSSKIAILLIINVLLLIVGIFMEALAAIVILVPILLPIVTGVFIIVTYRNEIVVA